MTAEAPEQETYGLSPDRCPHLIAKLRNMNPEQRATITHHRQENH